jgi:hypothetical protein
MDGIEGRSFDVEHEAGIPHGRVEKLDSVLKQFDGDGLINGRAHLDDDSSDAPPGRCEEELNPSTAWRPEDLDILTPAAQVVDRDGSGAGGRRIIDAENPGLVPLQQTLEIRLRRRAYPNQHGERCERASKFLEQSFLLAR